MLEHATSRTHSRAGRLIVYRLSCVYCSSPPRTAGAGTRDRERAPWRPISPNAKTCQPEPPRKTAVCGGRTLYAKRDINVFFSYL